MISRNPREVSHRPGTFDDPKTKDWLWPDDEPEPGCYRCGKEPADNDVDVPTPDGVMTVYYCDECYKIETED
jgi:hypothetical protein